MTDDEAVEPKPTPSTKIETIGKLVCEHCGDVAGISRTMLSIYTGKTVRLFECKAGHWTWIEG